MRYQFDSYELDTEKLELLKNGVVVPVEPQVFALLELLIANPDRVVSKQEINERIWGGRVVSDAAVNSRIKSARAAVGDNGKRQSLIKTLRDRGFRFVAPVQQSTQTQVQRSQLDNTALVANQLTEQPQTQTQAPSIAVLPMNLLSLDTRYEPLADAIAHEVIADLSKLHWLKVISRASTFKLRDSQDLNHVSDVLGVDYVLCGTMALFNDQATVTVELTRTHTNQTVWADRIETPLDELIALRGRLSTRVANVIEQRIQSTEAQANNKLATEDLNAWTSYFRGLRHAHRFNKHDNEIAMHLFERAIQLDSQFALAHAGLSFAHFQNAFVGYVSDIDQAQQLALQHSERAFELDQLDPIASLMIGRANILAGQWEQAQPWLERCAKISPNNAQAYYNQGLLGIITGDTTQTPNLTIRAASLSPIDPMQYAFFGARALGHLANNELEDALDWGVKAANAPRAHHLIDAIAAAVAQHSGDKEVVKHYSQRLRQRAPDFEAAHFFRSFPIQDQLRAQLLHSFTAMGFK